MITRWGAAIDRECPLPEYPRPQLMRNNWKCLNGIWEYAICNSENEPGKYDGEIIVPFSPESLLSEVNRQLLPGQTLWYRRELKLNPKKPGERSLIHFGAVDQYCTVYINGKAAGHHEGGYFPFSFDITDLVREGVNVLTVAARDDSETGIQAYGKQKLSPGGIWYTAQSGIWQTVWVETVPEQFIQTIKITPDYDAEKVKISLQFSQKNIPEARVVIYSGESKIAESYTEDGNSIVPLPGFKPWSPDDPFLYTVKITAGEDTIESYFGMRKFGIVRDEQGYPRLGLNGKPIFHSGLLDQGYWSDGLYTPPSDDAMIWEIGELKKLGFNMLRKHIKIEPLRWYYHCDRLGMLVWQDFVSGGGPYGKFVTQYLPFVGIHISDTGGAAGFGRRNKDGRTVFTRDMARTVDLLYNTVSLSVWVPFNEGWGQFEARRIMNELLAMDNTRLIDHASGYHDQGCGDFKSYHVYYKPFRMKADKRRDNYHDARIQALTEFGGYSCPTPGHMASDKLFGYRMYHNKAELTEAINKLYTKEVIPKKAKGLSAAIYTQVSDVEEEINGLFTFDRAELKPEASVLSSINAILKKPS
ncbi:MAG: glycoside hydrolase family 2 [Treponema sp.]|nr:glycoside hydrolase family 2 [Treponema sp.]